MDDDTRITDGEASEGEGLGPGANTAEAKPEDWETDPASNPDDEDLKRVKGG